MKVLPYTLLIVGLVPLQSVLLPHVSLWNVRPDLALVAVCFVGFLAGELDGLLMGFAIGWVTGIFSAGDLSSSMVTKGMAGLFAGLAGRQMAQITPTVFVGGLFACSCLAGLGTAWSVKLAGDHDVWWAIRAVIVPQACFDAAVGGVLYWAVWNRLDVERSMSDLHA